MSCYKSCAQVAKITTFSMFTAAAELVSIPRQNPVFVASVEVLKVITPGITTHMSEMHDWRLQER